MIRLLALLALILAAPLTAQDLLPPAPYAYKQLDDPRQEEKAQARERTGGKELGNMAP